MQGSATMHLLETSTGIFQPVPRKIYGRLHFIFAQIGKSLDILELVQKKYGRLYFIFAQMGNSSDLLKTKLERLVLRNTELKKYRCTGWKIPVEFSNPHNDQMLCIELETRSQSTGRK